MIDNVQYPFKNRYYKHLIFLIIIPIYLTIFTYAEEVIQTHYWPSYLPIDDKIPFCEWFIFPYITWYGFLFFPGLYFAYRNSRDFARYMLFFGVGFISVVIFDLIFPNGQNLRPHYFTRSNIAIDIVRRIYRGDTNTNVFPSMHVIGSVGVALAVLNCESLKNCKILRPAVVVMAVIISFSTVFVKQHSILDVIVALPWSLGAWHLSGVLVNVKRKRQKPLKLKL